MNRREFIKKSTLAAAGVALLPGQLPAQTDKAAAPKPSGTSGDAASGTGKVPDFAKDLIHSDMDGIGPDGKPTGQRATYTGVSKANAEAEKAMKHKMKLTKEEQAILDGKEGKEKAKLMKILVAFGNAFGAEKLVDLGGAPHSNMFIGTAYMKSMIKMLDECAKAGLKAYAPYTVNPRPYDVYNVQNNPKDMTMIYEGYRGGAVGSGLRPRPPRRAGPEQQNLCLLPGRDRQRTKTGHECRLGRIFRGELRQFGPRHTYEPQRRRHGPDPGHPRQGAAFWLDD